MFLLLSLYISFPLNLSYCTTLSISISLIAAYDQRFLFDLPIVFLSFSIFLACSRGSSVDRVSSMRTERPGVGRQLLRRPTKASTTTTTTTTTIITTDTGAAAPAVPAPPSPPLRHPGLAIALPSNFSFFLPRDFHSRNVPRHCAFGPSFCARYERRAGACGEKTNFRPLLRLEIGRVCIR